MEIQKSNLEKEILSSLIIYNKYSKYIPELKRRETWDELVTRNKEMHIRKFPQLKEEIEEAYKFVYDKKILPSMRSLQFGGKTAEINNARMFNCSYLPIDDYASFSEIMFLLLSGCGVGYSVQSHHIEQLPEIRKPLKWKRYLIGDSIEGWADAVKVLMKGYFGKTITGPLFDFRDIRPKGASLITTGGKAPGPEPLKIALTHIQAVLDRKKDGDKLTSLECHDIVCHLADAVLSGGIRRAALIAGFDVTDEEMLTCKFGSWWEENPQRGRANNTAVLLRNRLDKETFLDLWKKIELSNSGEPGFLFTNDKDIFTNPCITGDTWVTTKNGPNMVKNILGQKTKLLKDGEFFDTTDLGFIETGFKPVYEMKLDNGVKIEATLNHQFLTDKGWKELKDIELKDNIVLSNNQNVSWEGTGGNKKEGWLLGNLIGDGTYGKESQAILQYWGDSKFKMKLKAYDLLIKNTNHVEDLKLSETSYSEKYNKTSINSKELSLLAKKWDVIKGNKKLTEKIENGSSEFYKGIIGGLFDADGSVYISNGGVAIDISQSDIKLLEQTQRMLFRLGIPSKITLAKKEGTHLLPSSKFYEDGSLKEYYCKNNYILRISTKDNVIKFFNTCFINDDLKVNKYNSLISKYVTASYKKNHFISKVKAISYVGDKTVYDCTVPETSCFDANGIITHNCGEISLKPTQFCNLCEINASDLESQDEFNARSKAAAFIGTLQASYTDFHYLRDIWKKTTEKEALLGIGMTGIASGTVLGLNMKEAAKIAVEENERVAKIIGVNKAARVTTVKPSGTTSLVLGTSSGIHAWHDNYYIRRIRLGKNEALFTYLNNNHPELLEDDFFKPSLQSIVSIPQSAPEGSITRSESAFDLLERIKLINKNWIKPGHRKGANMHNVSATVSIKSDEWEPVGDWLYDNRDYFTALSFLPYDNHSYTQPPYETISKEQYDSMVSRLHNIDLSQIIEDTDGTSLMESVACGGSSCEII